MFAYMMIILRYFPTRVVNKTKEREGGKERLVKNGRIAFNH
jgi:hypothetical protein